MSFVPSIEYIEDFNRKIFLCSRPFSRAWPHFSGLNLANLDPVETFWSHGFVQKRPSNSEVQNPLHGGLLNEEVSTWKDDHRPEAERPLLKCIEGRIRKLHKNPVIQDSIRSIVELYEAWSKVKRKIFSLPVSITCGA
jgi:hypothetical protein